MSEGKNELEAMEKVYEVAPIAAYVRLIKWMYKEEIDEEALLGACKIYLLINDK